MYRIAAAGLPSVAGKLTRKVLRNRGQTALAYLDSSAYIEDQSNGKGICLSGDAAARSDLFLLVGKVFALQGVSIQYCTLHALVHHLEANDDARTAIARCEFLMLDAFEKDMRTQRDCPYTRWQQLEVEEFLTARFRAGKVTHFSSCKTWSGHTWWSADFIAQHSEQVVDISI